MVSNGKKNKNIDKQIAALKESLLKEFSEQLIQILSNLQVTTISGSAQKTQQANDVVGSDTPMFIPSQITTDTETELVVDEKESDTNSLDEAVKALRKLKEKKNG